MRTTNRRSYAAGDVCVEHKFAHVAEVTGRMVTTYVIPLHEVTRAITDGVEIGFVKLHIRDGTDHILGATSVARHAGEMIGEVTAAMTAGVGLRTLARVLHTSPVQASAIQMAAQAFCRTQLTPSLKTRLIRWLGR